MSPWLWPQYNTIQLLWTKTSTPSNQIYNICTKPLQYAQFACQLSQSLSDHTVRTLVTNFTALLVVINYLNKLLGDSIHGSILGKVKGWLSVQDSHHMGSGENKRTQPYPRKQRDSILGKVLLLYIYRPVSNFFSPPHSGKLSGAVVAAHEWQNPWCHFISL